MRYHVLIPLSLCQLMLVTHINAFLQSLPSLPTWLNPFSLWTITKNDICYPPFGCFVRFPSGPIKGLHTGMLPSSPEDINVQFLLFTCKNRFGPHTIPWNAVNESIAKSSFNPNLRTIFIVHGFRDLFDEMQWMGDMKDFILHSRAKAEYNLCESNVIAVDWHNGSMTSLYGQAVANTMVVGTVIANAINQIIEVYQLSPQNFTLVGHSLGAHVSGFVGEHFKSNPINNILGLDPAGPGFIDVNQTFRLDPTDASLVVSIHTNGGEVVGDNFGIDQPLGHYSFFPNGGHQQPGCEKSQAITKVLTDGLVTGLTDTVACSHRRVTKLIQFDPSLYTDSQGVGYMCNDYESFVKGKCAECDGPQNCMPFEGFFDWWQYQRPPTNWKRPIRLYLTTTEQFPWLSFDWQVVVATGKHQPVAGKIFIRPIGSMRKGELFELHTNEDSVIKPNQFYYHKISFPKSIGLVQTAEVSFVPARNGTKASVVIDKIEFNYMSEISKKRRKTQSTNLVSMNGALQPEIVNNFESVETPKNNQQNSKK